MSDFEDVSGRQKKWEYIKPVADKGRLLTMTEVEAKEYGFAKAIVGDEKEVLDYLGVDSWEVWQWDWGETAVGFLNGMVMTYSLLYPSFAFLIKFNCM